MPETQIIDSRAMTPELLEHQAEIQKLWKELSRLPKLRISEVIEIPSTLPVFPGKLTEVSPFVVGLEEGRLIAVKSLHSQPESYNLLCLGEDAHYETEFPLKPVIVTHDPDNPTLPVPIRVEKWPFGFKIYWYSKSRDWAAYHQADVSYHELSEAIADEAKEVCRSVRGNAPIELGITHHRF